MLAAASKGKPSLPGAGASAIVTSSSRASVIAEGSSAVVSVMAINGLNTIEAKRPVGFEGSGIPLKSSSVSSVLVCVP